MKNLFMKTYKLYCRTCSVVIKAICAFVAFFERRSKNVNNFLSNTVRNLTVTQSNYYHLGSNNLVNEYLKYLNTKSHADIMSLNAIDYKVLDKYKKYLEYGADDSSKLQLELLEPEVLQTKDITSKFENELKKHPAKKSVKVKNTKPKVHKSPPTKKLKVKIKK